MLFMSLTESFFFVLFFSPVFTYRLFVMTITHLTPNTAYARCSETESSLRLENGCMQLRPTKKYGNGMHCTCGILLRGLFDAQSRKHTVFKRNITLRTIISVARSAVFLRNWTTLHCCSCCRCLCLQVKVSPIT